MLTIRLDPQVEKRYKELAKMTGRSKSYYIREALQEYIDDIEDTYIALYRLEHPTTTTTLKEMRKGYKKKWCGK